jgi:uncharacterized membrane protein YGL010W
MHEFFRHQLGIYAGYHRDERNHATHVFGIPIIFFAIILLLSLWQITAFGVTVSVALIVVIPLLIVWILLDIAIGLALLAVVVPLVLLAMAITDHASSLEVCSIAAGLFLIGWALQLVGHALFEHRKPALMDHPMHLLIGPMFVVAKLFVALGLRRDLAFAVQPAPREVEG